MRPLHLRLFLRIVNRNRDVFFLKVVTLSIAFACAIVITLFVFRELDFDNFHRDSELIFRVIQKNNNDNSSNPYSAHVPEKAARALIALGGDSLTISPVKILDGLDILCEGKVYHNQKFHAADTSIASVFTFDLVDGSWKNFNFNQPSIVLSTSMSRHYFGTSTSEGKVIKLSFANDTLALTVAAVFSDFPDNSHEGFKGFVLFDSTIIRRLNYDPSNGGLYGRVKQKDISHFQKLVEKQMNNATASYTLQPIGDIYFGPRVRGEDARHGDEYSIYILLCITSLILFLAITGYINLTVITLPHRSKEIAIKKIAGTGQVGLLSLFAKESFIISALACILGFSMLILLRVQLLPILSIDPLSLLTTVNGKSLLVIVTILLLFVFSPLLFSAKFTRASPNRLLSSDTITFPRFKRIIVFLQLGISIFLIVASMVMRRQVTYSLVKEPGQNHDQVVYLDYPRHLSLSLTSLRNSLKMNNANVVDVIATSQLPHRINSKELGTDFYFVKVDPEFRDFFDVKMIQGNWFKANDGDSIIVVNEKAKQLLGADTTNVIGTFGSIAAQFDIPEKPLKIFRSNNFEYNFLCIRLLEVDIRRTVSSLSNHFANNGTPATIRFMNPRFEQWLTYQDRINQLSEVMAMISALLACCGIYGLCVSLVREKIKQIAIHKLFGAHVGNITLLLIKEFAIQLAIAGMIFGPITYLVIQEMLRKFIYRTHFVWMDPLIPLVYCIVVISLLCGFQASRLNRKDLTSSLKS